ncbi:MAG: prolyl oligopeptidase family serine peptidase [Prolixibacteraceae bacterium]|jgi:prolyl oligopeptidase|nr:prolyl oligopeptidase family serine peptidase [Prolixibacteraceae bacterium]
MNKILLLTILAMAFGCKNQSIDYPETRKDAVKDTIFGVEIEDPYRWLEDDNSEETAQWVEAQNKVTFEYLESLPGREKIKNRLTELWDYPKTGTPFNVSGRWFIFKNDGLQNQSVLYTMESPDDEPELIMDPNTLSDDGTVAFSGMDVSPEGKYLVYKIARSGSDWNEIFVMDIETRELLDDHIEWVKFSGVSCYADGFFYSAYEQPQTGQELSVSNQGQKIYFHKYGTKQEQDELIFANPEQPNRMYSAGIDSRYKYLFIVESESTSGNGLYIKKLDSGNSNIIKLAEGFENDFSPIEIADNKLLVNTNSGAPKYRVIAFDLNNPAPDNFTEVIPESENTLQNVSFCGNKLFAHYMEDAKSKINILSTTGQHLGSVNLPGICSAGNMRGTYSETTAFYSYSSYNTPGTILQYDTETGKSEVFFEPEVKFNPEDFIVKQDFYESKDGTKIPMFIIHKKGIELNGTNPAMLYGYGGFNISLTPSYSTSVLYYIEQGGVYAVANLRGGGEYGEKWHKAGTKMQKQNVFNDFIAAAEYLIDTGYTNSEKLTIRGGSNGGLLVGAVTNQRPDLIKVALPAVGVMDMLRYHKFTIGYAWASDYGRADDSKEMFDYLLGYSPLHTVKAQDYPAILATTADHDDRVVPAHTFKYISRVQELNTGDLPTLVRIDVKAGHGSGKPTSKIIEEYTDIYAFVFHHTGIKVE